MNNYIKYLRRINIALIVGLVAIASLFLAHSITLIIVLSGDKSKNFCTDYFNKEVSKKIEWTYHFIRMFYLTLINAWLIYSTCATWNLIKKHSKISLFRAELIKIGICYWSFIISYAAWFFWYLAEIPIEYGHGNKESA